MGYTLVMVSRASFVLRIANRLRWATLGGDSYPIEAMLRIANRLRWATLDDISLILIICCGLLTG